MNNNVIFRFYYSEILYIHVKGGIMLTFRQVEAFRAMMLYKQVSKASESLYISQPSMSRLLQDIERSLTIVLFKRSKNRLIPTKSAYLLYAEVEKSFSGLQDINDKALQLKRGLKKQIRIMGLPFFMNDIFVDMMAYYLNLKGKDLYIKSETRISNMVLQECMNSRCDIGFISDINFNKNDFYLVKEFRIPCVCIYKKGDVISSKETITYEDIEQLPFVGISAKTKFGHELNQNLKKNNIKLNKVLELSSFSLVSQFVAKGFGVGIVDVASAKNLSSSLDYKFFTKPIYFPFMMVLPRPLPHMKPMVDEVNNCFSDYLNTFIQSECFAPKSCS